MALGLMLAACATAPPHPSVPATPPVRLEQRERLLQAAESMVGQPYKWGGAAPGGFDCSGLVVFAAGAAGIRVPRTAHEQLNAGVPVARADIRPGDLVFMHVLRKELHVGIALDPDRFIHAPSAGGRVRIDSLSVTPYSRGFLAARRIVDTAP